MDNQFENKGKDQNIAQGDGAIGKQTNISGVHPEVLAKYAEELGETKQIITGFFTTLLEQEVPREQWDSKLREIAKRYKELSPNEETMHPEKLDVLKEEDRRTATVGDHAEVEKLQNQAQFYNEKIIDKSEQADKAQSTSAVADNTKETSSYNYQSDYMTTVELFRHAITLVQKYNFIANHKTSNSMDKMIARLELEFFRRGQDSFEHSIIHFREG